MKQNLSIGIFIQVNIDIYNERHQDKIAYLTNNDLIVMIEISVMHAYSP